MTYVEGVNLAVKLVNADAFDGASPLLAIFPHERRLLHIEVARSQKTASCMDEQILGCMRVWQGK